MNNSVICVFFYSRTYKHACVCLVNRYGRNEKLGNNLRVSDIVHHLRTRKGESLYVQAKFVVDTLNRYMSSADDVITTAHVPNAMMDKDGQMKSVDHAVKMVKH